MGARPRAEVPRNSAVLPEALSYGRVAARAPPARNFPGTADTLQLFSASQPQGPGVLSIRFLPLADEALFYTIF